MKAPRFEWDGEFSFSDEEMALIDRINGFLTRPLSPRWIYYGIFDVPDAKQQRFLNHVLNKARKDARQLIDRDMVTDDTRNPTIWQSSKNLKEFLSNLSYTRSVWQNQPTYYEVWMEDQASLQALVRSPKAILQKYRINARYCKGFNSIGAMWEAHKYFDAIDKPVRILYYGDLNPSGWAIPVIIVRQFEEMGLDIELERLALNGDQLTKYSIKAFTKISGDPRRKEFNTIFGFTDWENEDKQPYVDDKTGKTKWGKKHLNIDLEKIPPDDFEDMVDKDIVNHIDVAAFKRALRTEKREDKRLKTFKDASTQKPKNQ